MSKPATTSANTPAENHAGKAPVDLGRDAGKTLGYHLHNAGAALTNSLKNLGTNINQSLNGGNQTSDGTEKPPFSHVTPGGVIGAVGGVGIAWLASTLFGGGIVGMLAFGMMAMGLAWAGSTQLGPWINDKLGVSNAQWPCNKQSGQQLARQPVQNTRTTNMSLDEIMGSLTSGQTVAVPAASVEPDERPDPGPARDRPRRDRDSGLNVRYNLRFSANL